MSRYCRFEWSTPLVRDVKLFLDTSRNSSLRVSNARSWMSSRPLSLKLISVKLPKFLGKASRLKLPWLRALASIPISAILFSDKFSDFNGVYFRVLKTSVGTLTSPVPAMPRLRNLSPFIESMAFANGRMSRNVSKLGGSVSGKKRGLSKKSTCSSYVRF